MLRTHGRKVEAEAALRAATQIDSLFAEAWYNLGDLLDDQGRSEAAIECLRKNQCADAADYWRRYLAHDGHSEWAARARRCLKFCEMQGYLIASA